MYGTTAAVFSLLLIVTGVAKIRSPQDVNRALAALGLPSFRSAGLLIGAAEVAVGIAALFAAVGLLAQGILYLGFAIWVLVALRRDVPLASCGCLGKDDTPPTVGHLVMNLIAVAASLGAVAGGPIRLGEGIVGVAQLVVVGVGVFLSYVVLTDGARLVGVRER